MNNFDIIDEYGCTFDYKYLDEVINHTLKMMKVENANLSIIFIDDETMHRYNLEYRGIDRTTDVLSFALEDNQTFKTEIRQLGDIFISIPKMQKQAKEYNHSEKRELSFLTVHGLLHLLGYDHTRSEEEERIQFELQDKILNELNIIV
ncbi:MAG: rRNA maturation RNase YbeY [Bacilli bacterium]|nr:rRNA maturation RNase YbeY [Bacilli bacterium]